MAEGKPLPIANGVAGSEHLSGLSASRFRASSPKSGQLGQAQLLCSHRLFNNVRLPLDGTLPAVRRCEEQGQCCPTYATPFALCVIIPALP